MIEIFKLILLGDEKKVIEIYRKIYDQGVEPKIFLNDFLELLYYFKNINYLTLESTNFSLNDQEFLSIKEMSKNIDNQVLVLYWQFTIRTLSELDLVSNQNLSIEMFLTGLMHLVSSKTKNDHIETSDLSKPGLDDENKIQFNNNSIDQIKNISQEKNLKSEIQTNVKPKFKSPINSLDELLEVCTQNKEVKLKYEIEKNVNLVSFEKNRIEISFNDRLDKNFVKDLSLKLFEWTNERWIITLSKIKGNLTIKEKEKDEKNKLLEKAKETKIYKNVLNNFSDATLVDVKRRKEDDR